MKTLTDDLINEIAQGDELQDSIPEGYHAIKGVHATTGKKGFILMPDELSVDDWIKNQDKRPYQKPDSSSKSDKGVKSPHRCNAAQIRDITAPTPTPADEAADEAAFDKLFPDLETD